MLPFFFMSPLAMELLKLYFRHGRAVVHADASAAAAASDATARPRLLQVTPQEEKPC
jgi:hypothetical protein